MVRGLGNTSLTPRRRASIRKPESNNSPAASTGIPGKFCCSSRSNFKLDSRILVEFEQHQLGIHNGHLFPSFAAQPAESERDLQNDFGRIDLPNLMSGFFPKAIFPINYQGSKFLCHWSKNVGIVFRESRLHSSCAIEGPDRDTIDVCCVKLTLNAGVNLLVESADRAIGGLFHESARNRRGCQPITAEDVIL